VALPVDAVAGPQTSTVEPLAPPLGVTPWVQGAAVLGEARVVLVLAVAALLEAAG
jgi:chemotaxis protein histidine kinase CheA